ncbi:MAG: hypothetical protein AAF805_00680 [Planctomycetota bacterium]
MSDQAVSGPTPTGPTQATPWAVRASAAIAWLIASLALARAASEAVAPTGCVACAAGLIGFGAWAAYLGMALTRRASDAWRCCREIARFAGLVNVGLVPAVVVAALLLGPTGVIEGLGWQTIDSLASLATLLLVVGVAPAAVYFALGSAEARSWFGVGDGNGVAAE